MSVGPLTTRAMCVDDMSGETFEWRWTGHLHADCIADSSPTVADVRLNPVPRDDGLHDHEDSDDELAILERDADAAAATLTTTTSTTTTIRASVV